MKTSLTELISVIQQRLESTPNARLTDPGLRRWLTQKGYSKRDIDTAFTALLKARGQMLHRSPGNVRQLAWHESIKLSQEVREALARFDMYEMLDPLTREIILERLSQFEGEAGMEELDYALSWAFAPSRDVETIQTLYTILDGASETIH